MKYPEKYSTSPSEQDHTLWRLTTTKKSIKFLSLGARATIIGNGRSLGRKTQHNNKRVKKKATSGKGRGRQAAAATATTIVSMVAAATAPAEDCMVKEFASIKAGTKHTELVVSAAVAGNTFNTAQAERLLAKFNEVHQVPKKIPLVLIQQDVGQGKGIVCHEIITDQAGRPQLIPFEGKTRIDHCIIYQVEHGGILI